LGEQPQSQSNTDETKNTLVVGYTTSVHLSLQAKQLVEALQAQGAATATKLAVLVFGGLAQQRFRARLETDLLHEAETLALATAAETGRPLGVQSGVATKETIDQDEVSLVDSVVFVLGHL